MENNEIQSHTQECELKSTVLTIFSIKQILKTVAALSQGIIQKAKFIKKFNIINFYTNHKIHKQ